jgi:hypothetical protein
MKAPLSVLYHYETLEGVLTRLDAHYLRTRRTGAEVWDHLIATKRIEWNYERTPALDGIQALTVWARKCSGRGW